MKKEKIAAIVLVRDGAIIPHVKVAQCTKDIDWTNIQLNVYSTSASAKGFVYLPSDNLIHEVVVDKRSGKFVLQNDSYGGTIKWTIISNYSNSTK